MSRQQQRKKGANMHLPASLRNELVSLGRIDGDRPAANPAESNGKRSKPTKRPRPETDTGRKKQKLDHDAPPKQANKPTALEKMLAKQQGTKAGPKSTLEANEDAEIAWLEAKLGKTSKDEFQDDGLDDLFSGLDDLEQAAFGYSKKDYATLLKQQRQQEPQSDDEQGSSDDDDDQALVHPAPPSQDGESDEYNYDDEEFDHPSDDEELSGSESSSSASSQAFDPSIEVDEEWTGIQDESETLPEQSAVETKDAEPSGKYVPPHLRQQQSQAKKVTVEIDPRLKKLLVSNLNKLSPLNIGSLLPNFEDVYRKHPRAIVNDALVTLILDRIQEKTEMGESFVASFAALVAALSRSIGGLREEAVGRAIEALTAESNADNQGKERKNIAAWLCYLYEFRVIAAGLVFDLVRWAVNRGLGEDEVELLLKIVKGAGRQIRSDDPAALKEIVGLVKKQVEGSTADSGAAITVRAKFMLEQLTNVRNNKLPPPNETAAQLKKFLSSYGAGVVRAPLSVSLSDILSADKKGKWWVVGAAWSGDPLVDAAANVSQGGLAVGIKKQGDDKLSKLARKMGMNTDVRKDIFRVLMTSEDYVDACERLSQLSLSEKQQREIARVLLQCSGNEKTYNPYYTLVANQLARKSRSFAITLQYCLWDLFREMGQAEVGGQERTAQTEAEAGDGISPRREENLSRLFGWCIAKEGLTLNIFKPVPFHRLAAQPASFLRSTIISVILASQTTSPTMIQPKGTRKDKQALEKICVRAIDSPQVRDGLVLFLDSIEDNSSTSKDPIVKWGRKVMVDTLRDGASLVL